MRKTLRFGAPFLIIVGKCLGKTMARLAKRQLALGADLRGVQTAIKEMFPWPDGLQFTNSGAEMTTSEKCQVFRVAPIFCEKACPSFSREWAKVFRCKIEMVKKQPRDASCDFVYKQL